MASIHSRVETDQACRLHRPEPREVRCVPDSLNLVRMGRPPSLGREGLGGGGLSTSVVAFV